MKVLLLGEFSGFFTNLKHGLQELGVDVTLASCSDNWKKIDGTDIKLFDNNYHNYLEKINNLIFEPYINRNILSGYDVVQMVHPIPYSLYINRYMFDYIKKNNGSVFVSVAGDCYSVYKSYKEGKLGYYVYDDNPENCLPYEGSNYKTKIRIRQEEYIFDNVDGIIPIMYEYAVGVRKRKNCLNTIPLPFDASSIEYTPNVVKNKIVILHGIIREKYKGSQIIKEALNIIASKYPNDVEVIIDGKMPLSDYLQLLRRTNVLIDQCKEHCWGMNACYAMAEGRIVLGGASRNSLKEFNISNSPIIHIKPEVNQIVAQIENIIDRKREIEMLGLQSRQFVEDFHNCIKIAQQYVDVWKGNQIGEEI